MLAGALGVAAVGLSSASASAATPRRYPFTLGVASGDPRPDGVVLWTRLAPDPFEPDGGMAAGPVDVEWQIAEDDRGDRPVRSGAVRTDETEAHSVHLELDGLEPGREYFYRFRVGRHLSTVGRTRTAPAPGSSRPLRAAVASCANFEHGYFTAYRYMADAEPDLVLFLGDYIYETAPGTSEPPDGLVRLHGSRRPRTVEDYRLRYAEYKSDPDLLALHAAAPWAATIDDHEVQNNWAGRHSADEEVRARWPALRQAALQAYWEHLPLPRAARPTRDGARLHRRLSWGSVATIHLLDTRQYRDPPACGDPARAKPTCAELALPGRSMLGAAQEAWLADGLRSSGAEWDLLAQQVMFSGNYVFGDDVNADSWDGFPDARRALLQAAADAGTRNLVVLTGDTHKAWAADIRPVDPLRPAPGVEFGATSVTTLGDGEAGGAKVARAMRAQPHLRFGDERRGWVALTVEPGELRAQFQALEYVSDPESPVETAAAFLVATGTGTLAPIQNSQGAEGSTGGEAGS